MLLNELFIIEDWQPGDGFAKATIRVYAGHRILQGHFPGRPVVPGACLVQLVEELAAPMAGIPVRLLRAGPVKFIAMIEPRRDPVFLLTLRTVWLDGDDWQLAAEAEQAGAVCFKFTGTFRAGSGYAD